VACLGSRRRRLTDRDAAAELRLRRAQREGHPRTPGAIAKRIPTANPPRYSFIGHSTRGRECAYLIGGGAAK
jgi:hypothetical protein